VSPSANARTSWRISLLDELCGIARWLNEARADRARLRTAGADTPTDLATVTGGIDIGIRTSCRVEMPDERGISSSTT
jgi:hypothetical protein